MKGCAAGSQKICSYRKVFPLDRSIKQRSESIDLFRGIIMMIMALDHTRDFFHHYSFNHDPTDLTHTSVWIFFTRFITHFCAPMFIFLSGVSAFLSEKSQSKTKQEASWFLFKRGLFLIFLELTVVYFGWYFNPYFETIVLQVIWALGVSMIFLSLFMNLPIKVTFVICMGLVFGHNLLDTVHVSGDDFAGIFWAMLHEFKIAKIGRFELVAAYPMIPWIGVMGLGYCFGFVFLPGFERQRRVRWLNRLGLASLGLFVVLRAFNFYGDAKPWSFQEKDLFTFLSFINLSKYPPSLLFLLLLLGSSFLFLSFLEKKQITSSIVQTFGRVPLFFYILHLYIIHSFALIALYFTGFSITHMIRMTGWVGNIQELKSYGFTLPQVYGIWAFILCVAYFFCKRFDVYKRKHRYAKAWLAYF